MPEVCNEKQMRDPKQLHGGWETKQDFPPLSVQAVLMVTTVSRVCQHESRFYVEVLLWVVGFIHKVRVTCGRPHAENKQQTPRSVDWRAEARPSRGAATPSGQARSVPRVHRHIQMQRSFSPGSLAWVWKLSSLFREATCSWELNSGQSKTAFVYLVQSGYESSLREISVELYVHLVQCSDFSGTNYDFWVNINLYTHRVWDI